MGLIDMKLLSRLIKLIWHEERGNVLFIVAGSLILLMGMAALVIDVGGMYGTRRHMVNSADAAALAASMENHEGKAYDIADSYAKENYNATLVDVVFTYPPSSGPGQGQGQGQGNQDGRITTVLVSKEVEFSFARILGFDKTEVYGMASAQRGAGNGLVPFGLFADPCYCCYPNPDCLDPDCPEGDCDGCCGCIEYDEECDPPCPERYPDHPDYDPDHPDTICKVGHEDTVWKILNEDYVCAKPGDEFVLKAPHHMDSDFQSPGNFQLLEFDPDDKSVPSLRINIGGGYNGPLDKLKPGTDIGTEKGNKVAIESALQSRLDLADDPPCTTLNDLPEDIYRCDLVVVMPLARRDPNLGPGDTAVLEIVGYASFLLNFSDGAGGYEVDGSEVRGYLIEYLTYEELVDIYGTHLIGFVHRLVDHPPDAKQALLNLIQ